MTKKYNKKIARDKSRDKFIPLKTKREHAVTYTYIHIHTYTYYKKGNKRAGLCGVCCTAQKKRDDDATKRVEKTRAVYISTCVCVCSICSVRQRERDRVYDI